MRRKGEKPVEKTWPEWDCGYHPVRRMIADGDRWFQAWTTQASTPWAKLARRSGIAISRIIEINDGADVMPEEIEALAAVWNVDPAQVIASLTERSSVT